MREFVENPKNCLITAFVGYEVVGFVFGWEIPRLETKRHFYIDEVATAEKYQRQGIAKRMLMHLKEILIVEGVDMMYVLTEQDNFPANKLYESIDTNVSVEKGIVMFEYKFHNR